MKKSRLISFILSLALFVSCLPVSTAFAAPRAGSTAATAINVAFNTPFRFNWTRDNNYDSDMWVKVTLPSRGLLQFTGNKLINVTGEDDYVDFKLFKAADVNTPIWEAANSKFKMQTAYNINLPLNAGTYYFAITDMWLSEGESRNLNCTFKHIPANNYEIEPNGNINLANPLAFETRVYGINTNDDDTYKVTVTQDTPTRIKFGNLDLVDANASVKVTYQDGDSDYLTVGTYGAVKAAG